MTERIGALFTCSHPLRQVHVPPCPPTLQTWSHCPFRTLLWGSRTNSSRISRLVGLRNLVGGICSTSSAKILEGSRKRLKSVLCQGPKCPRQHQSKQYFRHSSIESCRSTHHNMPPGAYSQSFGLSATSCTETIPHRTLKTKKRTFPI
jgi:hypothetical protein